MAVNIIARTVGFSKGINNARRQLFGFREGVAKTTKRTTTLAKGFRSLGLSLGAVFSARAAAGFLKSQALQIDQLGKVARRLGIATEELGFLQFAADKAAINVNTLNIALQRMARRVGEAARGTGEAQETLQALGVDAAKLAKLPLGEQFEEILQLLNQIPNDNERISRFFKIFDSEGVAIAQMADSMGDARRAYNRFNIEVRGTDVKKIEDLVTQFSTLRDAVVGLGRGFLIDVGPEVQEALKGALVLVDLIIKARGGRGTALQEAADISRKIKTPEGRVRKTRLDRAKSFGSGFGIGAGLGVVSAAITSGVGAAGLFPDPRDRDLNPRRQEARRQSLIGGRPEFADSQPAAQQSFKAMEAFLEQIVRNTGAAASLSTERF